LALRETQRVFASGCSRWNCSLILRAVVTYPAFSLACMSRQCWPKSTETAALELPREGRRGVGGEAGASRGGQRGERTGERRGAATPPSHAPWVGWSGARKKASSGESGEAYRWGFLSASLARMSLEKRMKAFMVRFGVPSLFIPGV
jgi:hypothetical protein